MVNCIQCLTSISRNKQGIQCEGCKNHYHASCVSKNVDLSKLLDDIPGLSWKCSLCVKNCLVLDSSGIKTLVDDKLNDALCSLKDHLKADITKSVTNTNLQTHQAKYSDVLKDKSQAVILVQPKHNQNPSTTKADILHNINPLEENLRLSKIKPVKDGGFVIGCSNKDDNEKVLKMVQQKMSSSYDVKMIEGIQPRIKVVGMSENFTTDTITDYLFKCNDGIFVEKSACKILKITPTRKNPKIFQVILQVDKDTYERALTAGNVFIAYDSCKVYDAVELLRCFNCNEYNHSSKKCEKSICCPLCAEGHSVKDCTSISRKCSNCFKLKNTNIAHDHAVWEKERCSVYINALNRYKSNLSLIK